jgi:hypothetical protein
VTAAGRAVEQPQREKERTPGIERIRERNEQARANSAHLERTPETDRAAQSVKESHQRMSAPAGQVKSPDRERERERALSHGR